MSSPEFEEWCQADLKKLKEYTASLRLERERLERDPEHQRKCKQANLGKALFWAFIIGLIIYKLWFEYRPNLGYYDPSNPAPWIEREGN